jgi:hypothetical protein
VALCLITNLTWISLKTVPNLRGERPATERFSLRTVRYSWADKNTSLSVPPSGSPFYCTSSKRQLFYDVLCWFFLRSCHKIGAFEILNLEILLENEFGLESFNET